MFKNTALFPFIPFFFFIFPPTIHLFLFYSLAHSLQQISTACSQSRILFLMPICTWMQFSLVAITLTRQDIAVFRNSSHVKSQFSVLTIFSKVHELYPIYLTMSNQAIKGVWRVNTSLYNILNTFLDNRKSIAVKNAFSNNILSKLYIFYYFVHFMKL